MTEHEPTMNLLFLGTTIALTVIASMEFGYIMMQWDKIKKLKKNRDKRKLR